MSTRAPAQTKQQHEANHAAQGVRPQSAKTGVGMATDVMSLQRTAGNSAVNALVNSLGGGAPLPLELRGEMEQRFGEDFSKVRMHTDARAAQSADELNAKAFTFGSDIVFNKGRFTPGTMEGKRLLAHELAHVVQQSRGGLAPALDAHAAHENAAVAAATNAVAGSRSVSVSGATGVGIARAPDDVSSTPTTAQTQAGDRERELEADVQLICNKLDALYYSEADENEVLAILYKWANMPNPPQSRQRPGSRYLEQLFMKLQQKTKDVGIVSEQKSSYYSQLFSRASRSSDLEKLRDSQAPLHRGNKGEDEISYGGLLWEDVKKGVVRDQIYAYNEGLNEGLRAGVKGMATALAHPIDTAEGISYAVTHFDQTKVGIKNLATDYWNTAAKNPVEFAKKTGNIVGQVEVAIAAPTIIKGGTELLASGAARIAPAVGKWSRIAIMGANLGMDYSFRPMAGGTPFTNVSSALSTTFRAATVVEEVAAPAAASATAAQEVTQAAVEVMSVVQEAAHTTQSIASTTAAVAPAATGAGSVLTPAVVTTAMQAAGQIADASQVSLTPAQFAQAMAHTFPSQYFDPVLQVVELIGQRAAQVAIANPAFVQACQNGNWALAGTLFHSAAATVGPTFANQLPQGFQVTFEDTIQSGLGGSRFDVRVTGPGVHREVDWKTTGRSALSFGSRSEMVRHATQYQTNFGTPLTGQESKSWIDFVRPFLPGINWPR